LSIESTSNLFNGKRRGYKAGSVENRPDPQRLRQEDFRRQSGLREDSNST